MSYRDCGNHVIIKTSHKQNHGQVIQNDGGKVGPSSLRHTHMGKYIIIILNLKKPCITLHLNNVSE